MEIIDRVKAPTPDFHKKLRNFALSLATAFGGILAAEKSGAIDLFSNEVEQGMVVAVIVLPAIAGTAQTAKVEGQ